MFGDAAPTPLRANRITAGEIYAIDRSYRCMPAILDDLGPKRFANHVHDIIKDETAPPSDEHPCFAISMNAEFNAFIPEITKRTLLLYGTVPFPANREQSRISMPNKLASIEPTTSLYRRYLEMTPFRTDFQSCRRMTLHFRLRLRSNAFFEGVGKDRQGGY